MQQQSFSIIEAATAGLELVRRRPKALVGASLIYLVGSLGGLAITLGPGAAVYTRLSDALAVPGDPTPETLMRVMESFARLGVMTLPVTLLTMAFGCALVFRALMRPDDSRFFYLRLGQDEARQLAVRLLATAVMLIGGGAVSIIATAIAALSPPALRGLVGFLGGCALIGVMVQLWVRLSLASAATFAAGSVRLSLSWRMSAGHLWRMLAAYILPAVAVFGLSQVWTVVVGLLTGGVVAQMNADMNAGGFDVRAYFAEHSAAMMLAHVLVAPMGGVQLLMTLAPGTAIYRALAGPRA